jgi:hypothetical protein
MNQGLLFSNSHDKDETMCKSIDTLIDIKHRFQGLPDSHKLILLSLAGVIDKSVEEVVLAHFDPTASRRTAYNIADRVFNEFKEGLF